jgi:hypothetical protein
VKKYWRENGKSEVGRCKEERETKAENEFRMVKRKYSPAIWKKRRE